MGHPRRWLFAFLLCGVLAGCASADHDRQAIAAVARQREQALTTRDLSLYLAILSPDYRDKGKDYAVKRAELATLLQNGQRLSYRCDDLTITVRGDQATYRCSYTLRVTGQRGEWEMAGREEIRLRKEANGWKIIGGL